MTIKEFFKKTNSPIVWLNLLGVMVLFIIIFMGTLWWMDLYTRHGESVDVPDLKGTSLWEANEELERLGLNCIILDSVYNTRLPQDQVIEQTPSAGTTVKEGRGIYITISTRYAPKQVIPEIINNCSYREAESKLRALGFKVAGVSYISGNKDWVYSIKQNSKSVYAGQKVDTSIPLTIVIGNSNMLELNESGMVYEGYDSLGPSRPIANDAIEEDIDEGIHEITDEEIF